jgi:UPF0716 family protein affecting phage T7 exclusion
MKIYWLNIFLIIAISSVIGAIITVFLNHCTCI